MSDYNPAVPDVHLPESLKPLVEALAARVHDTWARRRLDEGWTLGPNRDDAAKTNPGLVPYDELSETEKDYDRATVLTVLHALLELASPDQKAALESTLTSLDHDVG